MQDNDPRSHDVSNQNEYSKMGVLAIGTTVYMIRIVIIDPGIYISYQKREGYVCTLDRTYRYIHIRKPVGMYVRRYVRAGGFRAINGVLNVNVSHQCRKHGNPDPRNFLISVRYN